MYFLLCSHDCSQQFSCLSIRKTVQHEQCAAPMRLNIMDLNSQFKLSMKRPLEPEFHAFHVPQSTIKINISERKHNV